MNLNLKISLLVLAVSILFNVSGNAQTVAPNPDSVRAQNFYVELLGPGITFSANYDTRFSKKRDGLGGRIGVGYFADNDYSIASYPIQLNYLLGKKGKYFEIGAGATFVTLKDKQRSFSSGNYYYTDSGFGDFDDSGTIGTLTFGYRYQPVDGGFTFRGSFNPMFNSSQFLPYFGISLGYTFK